MPISALPQSTVRLLGSSLVITKPCDVVKELIDNAIDAGAGLVEIVVSPNCLDTIRVRDDGRGIDVDDFDALGRRAHTSKLKAFDELGLRAGESLGFRGEALAAVNALAVVAITTRTAKDVIATRLQLKSAVGGVENRRPVSAPVGTTVQVTRLFEALPARRQHSLKHSAKHIQAVKDLLTSYALARPDLRLSLKMVGETTYSWSYAPVCASGVDEAALQVFGKALANSCIHVSRNSACDQATPLQFDQQPPQDFILDALIPKPGFDAQAVKGKGLYLSVDSRPISSACDMAKKMTTIFKTCLNRIADTNGPCANISNPFMRLNIRCPPGSYDANVTPLKDEVVFGDEDRIAACFAGLCRKLYAERSVDDFFSSKRPSQHKRAAAQALAASVDCSEKQLTVLQGGAWNMARPTMQGNAPSSLTLESRSQERILPAKMRTSKAVNMSRTNSNSTDEDGAANSVDVQVPASLTTATHVPSGQRPDSGAPISKVSASENIERYLLSRKSGAFQIATDETATKRKQQPYTASKPPAEGSGRMPLQPLTESTLNTMRGETESDSDASSDELEMLEPDNNAEGIVAAYRRRQGARRTPPGSLRPSLELGSLEPHSPPPSNGVAEWPTPPSSGPLRSGADADDDVSTAQTCDIFSPDIFVGGASHDAAPVNKSASTSRGVCLKKVKRLARQACLLGYDAMPGNWGYAIEFKNMEDAGEVESRLHQAVNAWKRTQRQAVEVEYTLRSAAKGKSMGC
ncbi:dna mismatch repair [Trichoderma cornu-damae]|uniref:Dna mismatch repair n=1 Tax=Trichoderma cornu-damae TaxID=654480 RepID=A0A9P8QGS6_9HYPO|nr:dna mismatch repair [Trichoderma cornu-damae]